MQICIINFIFVDKLFSNSFEKKTFETSNKNIVLYMVGSIEVLRKTKIPNLN